MLCFGCILKFLGIIFLIKIITKIFNFIRKYILSRPIDFKKKYGNGWVVVTGGSEGIGYGFAENFAKLNYKVLIISRNEEKLKKAQNELKTKYPNAFIKYEVYDFNNNYEQKNIEQLKEILEPYFKDEISILFDNVGQLVNEYFLDMTDDQINKMININVKSVVFISKLIMEHMMKRNGKSLIVGSGSVDALFKYETRTVYSSTKAFLKNLFCVFKKEYGKKIDFTYLIIGAVETTLNPYPTPLKLNPEQFTAGCMNVIGQFRICAGHLYHAVLIAIFKLSPRFIKKMITDIEVQTEAKAKKNK